MWQAGKEAAAGPSWVDVLISENVYTEGRWPPFSHTLRAPGQFPPPENMKSAFDDRVTAVLSHVQFHFQLLLFAMQRLWDIVETTHTQY